MLVSLVHISKHKFNTYCSEGAEPEMRRHCNQNDDVNHSVILISTIIMFFLFHFHRVILSIYEAITIHSVLLCSKKRKGFYAIWYLYTQAMLQLVQVRFFNFNMCQILSIIKYYFLNIFDGFLVVGGQWLSHFFLVLY